MNKVLVVDHDGPLRFNIRSLLESHDYDVVEASNGRDALAQVAKESPDLVIMDIIMPEKEGIETILELRDNYPDLRIIATSSGGRLQTEEFLLVARRMRVVGTLKKPFQLQDLLDMVVETFEVEEPA